MYRSAKLEKVEYELNISSQVTPWRCRCENSHKKFWNLSNQMKDLQIGAMC